MLVLQDAAGGAVEAGEEKQQIVLEVEHRLSGHAQRLHGDPMILVEGEACDAAERRDELILLPNGLAQAIDFNIASEFGQLLCMSDLAAVRKKRLQQRRGEAARRIPGRFPPEYPQAS